MMTAGLTDVGQARDHNEDAICVDSGSELYAIADGMGGHMHGEVASQATLEELIKKIKGHATNSSGPIKQDEYYDIVMETVVACNELILEKNRSNGSALGEGMGTTLVGAYFLRDKKKVVVFNVGDSRLYRLRGGELQQLTRDHTMYQEWVEAGQKGTAPSRNILIKAIGLLDDIVPDITLETVSEGDLFLICSDGLSNMIEPEVMQSILNQNLQQSPEALCQELVSVANANGGQDNISAVVIRVVSSSSANHQAEDLDQTIQHTSVR